MDLNHRVLCGPRSKERPRTRRAGACSCLRLTTRVFCSAEQRGASLVCDLNHPCLGTICDLNHVLPRAARLRGRGRVRRGTAGAVAGHGRLHAASDLGARGRLKDGSVDFGAGAGAGGWFRWRVGECLRRCRGVCVAWCGCSCPLWPARRCRHRQPMPGDGCCRPVLLSLSRRWDCSSFGREAHPRAVRSGHAPDRCCSGRPGRARPPASAPHTAIAATLSVEHCASLRVDDTHQLRLGFKQTFGVSDSRFRGPSAG